jgi:dUTP pyrophosphatase
MEIQVIKSTTNELPQYGTIESAGCDLRAELSLINPKFLFNVDITYKTLEETIQKITINPGGRALIPTGLKFALPVGYEAQVRPRSGLALKYGITVLNTPGTIDSDYRGDVGVVLINHGTEPFVVNQGDRIAQLVISQITQVQFVPVDELSETNRGTGGFGSTGSI